MNIYFDNAATTMLDKEAFAAMEKASFVSFGNASSIHGFGRAAASAVENARSEIAKMLNAQANEIYFTSGGTESDNWAIIGAAKANDGKHIITTEIEHPAVLASCAELAKSGFDISYAKCDENGFVSLDEIKRLVRDDTVLISVMYANNEIGTIQPIKEIGEFCRSEGIIFHTDAVQAAGSVKMDVKRDKVDLLSLSAHKFHGPTGIGVLYVRSGLKIGKLLVGGHQERGYRAGTTNTAGAVGLATALAVSIRDMEKNNEYIKSLRDRFLSRALTEIPHCVLNGTLENRLVSNANISFEFIEGESILVSLDMAGIAVSSGSACSSGSLEPSHVILALGKKIEDAHGSIRFSFGRENTLEEVEYAVDTLKIIVEKLRNMSPLFKVEKGEEIYV